MSAYSTVTLMFQGSLGSRHFEIWSLTGDGAATTFDPGLACIDHAWLQNSTDTTIAASVLGISAGVITIAALTSGMVWWLFILGSA